MISIKTKNASNWGFCDTEMTRFRHTQSWPYTFEGVPIGDALGERGHHSWRLSDMNDTQMTRNDTQFFWFFLMFSSIGRTTSLPRLGMNFRDKGWTGSGQLETTYFYHMLDMGIVYIKQSSTNPSNCSKLIVGATRYSALTKSTWFQVSSVLLQSCFVKKSHHSHSHGISIAKEVHQSWVARRMVGISHKPKGKIKWYQCISKNSISGLYKTYYLKQSRGSG